LRRHQDRTGLWHWIRAGIPAAAADVGVWSPQTPDPLGSDPIRLDTPRLRSGRCRLDIPAPLLCRTAIGVEHRRPRRAQQHRGRNGSGRVPDGIERTRIPPFVSKVRLRVPSSLEPHRGGAPIGPPKSGGLALLLSSHASMMGPGRLGRQASEQLLRGRACSDEAPFLTCVLDCAPTAASERVGSCPQGTLMVRQQHGNSIV
jgi:hypothetical protein